MPEETAVEERPAAAGRREEFLDSAEGATCLRVGLLLIVLAAYLWTPAHRAPVWGLCKDLMALSAGLLFMTLFPGVGLLCRLSFMVGIFCLRSLDALLFALPRWVLRRKLGLSPGWAFSIAFGLQLAGVGAAGRYLAAQARLERRARFGPAVTRRLGISAAAAGLYRMRRGRILPLISPAESLRRHRGSLARSSRRPTSSPVRTSADSPGPVAAR